MSTTNTKPKAILAKLLALVLTVASVATAAPPIEAQAASVAPPSLSKSGYAEMIAECTVPIFTSSSLSKRGTTSPSKQYNAYAERGDVVYVFQVTSSYCYISYPTSNGRREGYCRTYDLLGNISSTFQQDSSKGNATTYKYPGGNGSYGTIEPGDAVYRMRSSGSYTLAMYTAKSGSRQYKIGWVFTDTLNKITAGSSGSSGTQLRSPLKNLQRTSVSASTNGIKCDFSASKGTPIYAPCDGTVVYQQVTATVSGTTKLASYANKIEFKSGNGSYKMILAHLSSFEGAPTPVTASWAYPCGAKQYKTSTNTVGSRSVRAGEVIGYTGATGNASGPHLHMELYKFTSGSWRAIDPLTTFSAW